MKRALLAVLFLAGALNASAQIVYNPGGGGTGGTAGISSGTSLPASCAPGDVFFKTNATAGANIYGCTTTDTWTLQGSFASPGTGVIVDTGGAVLANRTITGSNGVSCANGDGASGNPTCSVDSTVTRKGSASGAPPATCAGGGDTYQLGDWYTDTATDTTYRCNGTNLWVPMVAGRGALILTDEFCGGGLTNNTIGELSWGLGSIGGGSAVQAGTAAAEHPCWDLITEGTDNDGAVFSLGRSVASADITGKDWGIEAIVKLESTAGCAAWFGMIPVASVPTSTASMIALVYNTDLSHTNWTGVMCDSSTTGCQSAGDDTNQDATATSAAASTNWVRLSLWHRVSGVGSASTFYASVDGGTPVTWCAGACDEDLGNFPAVSLTPFIAFQDQVTGTKNFDVDWFKFWVTGLSR